ncbi:1-deoxy-D-xylulose 5-phosphate reductoisomerase family protein, partial [Chlamydia psittaci 06-1683]
KSESCF